MQEIKILYVEDYDLVLFTVKQLLELEHWQIEVCRDGEQALDKITGDRPYDLIILDVELPGLSGLTLLARIRELLHRRRTPVILFTARDCQAEPLAAQADACLRKPSGIKDLIATCQRLLKRAAEPGDTGQATGMAYGLN